MLQDSGAQIHACPIEFLGQKKVLWTDPGIHTVNGAGLKHDRGRLYDSSFRRNQQSECFFHACDVQKPSLPPRMSCKAFVFGVIFALTRAHCIFPNGAGVLQATNADSLETLKQNKPLFLPHVL